MCVGGAFISPRTRETGTKIRLQRGTKEWTEGWRNAERKGGMEGAEDDASRGALSLGMECSHSKWKWHSFDLWAELRGVKALSKYTFRNDKSPDLTCRTAGEPQPADPYATNEGIIRTTTTALQSTQSAAILVLSSWSTLLKMSKNV